MHLVSLKPVEDRTAVLVNCAIFLFEGMRVEKYRQNNNRHSYNSHSNLSPKKKCKTTDSPNLGAVSNSSGKLLVVD